MKKKILLLSDDLRMSSGVAVMSKEIVLGTVDKFDWIQLGAGINHPEYGKIIDVSEDVQKISGIEDANVKIIPYNGYGDISIIRRLMEAEKPDAILHFTDPRYWKWLYENEQEIRQQIPILYYHVWDNIPDPMYNRNFYESCDWIGCISKLTYGSVNRVAKNDDFVSFKPLKDEQIDYVPHGINSEKFKPLTKIDKVVKETINPNNKYNFILFFNNRNINRKVPIDVILSYKKFCDSIPKAKANKCLLLMHTNPTDKNGTDLHLVADTICPNYDIVFSSDRVEQQQLNQIYNVVDATINIASAEGFGLTTAESLMAGTPIIVNVTGGLQDQCGFNVDAESYIEIESLHDKEESKHLVKEGEWVIPVWPSASTIKGNHETPYIYDDFTNTSEVASAIKKMYNKTKKERKEMGKSGREYMIKNFSVDLMCEGITEGIEKTIKNFKPKDRFEFIKLT